MTYIHVPRGLNSSQKPVEQLIFKRLQFPVCRLKADKTDVERLNKHSTNANLPLLGMLPRNGATHPLTRPWQSHGSTLGSTPLQPLLAYLLHTISIKPNYAPPELTNTNLTGTEHLRYQMGFEARLQCSYLPSTL